MPRHPLITRAWEALLRAAQAIGRVQAWLLFTLFYFVVMAPAAVVFRLCADPLHLRRRRTPWVPRAEGPTDRLAWGRLQS
jgi:hypothetical protein